MIPGRNRANNEWWEAREKWEKECLREFSAKYGQLKPRLVEFSDTGDAYPHGIFGVGHIRRAVTPWDDSIHYLP